MRKTIFLSYAHQDDALVPAVRRLLRKQGILEPAHSILLDPQQDLKAGNNIREVIMESMKSASVVVVIDSNNSRKSQWVNYEIGMAVALGKPIVVVGQKGSWTAESILSSIENAQRIEMDSKD